MRPTPHWPARELEAGQPSADTAAEDASAWAEVQRARRADRPTGIDVAAALTTSWTELGGTDRTVRTALATAAGTRLVVLAFDRHHGNGRPTPAASARPSARSHLRDDSASRS